MILIADCSALIALSTCQQLNLLDELFCEVIVPEAVYYEATQPNKKQAKQLKTYLEDKVRRVDMQNYVFLDGFADAGETEAMVLYKQISADKLLIDDQRGRNVAKLNHINTIGSLGVLLVAKQRGLISEVAPLLLQLEKSDIVDEMLLSSITSTNFLNMKSFCELSNDSFNASAKTHQ
jgi:predicted nucleic acid-binding protein